MQNGTSETRLRWERLAGFFRSPMGGTNLAWLRDPDRLVDEEGHVFSLLDGEIVLSAEMQKFLSNHYEICRSAGAAPASLLTADQGWPARVDAFLLGRPIALSDFTPLPGDNLVPHEPGTLVLERDDLIVWSAAGAATVGRFAFKLHLKREVTVAQDLCNSLPVPSPLFLLAERFPSPDLVKYYEMILYLSSKDIVNSLDETEAARQRALMNAPFLADLFARFNLAIERMGALDLGGGGLGFLGAAMEMAGARNPISTDIRNTDVARVYQTFPECPRLLIAVADMFEWCYAEKAFCLIGVRNNSALCMASNLATDANIEFLRCCTVSLAERGLLYLTVISDESGRIDGGGLTNRPLVEYLDWVTRSGLAIVALTKVGSQSALLCCRPERLEDFGGLQARYRDVMRRAALAEYGAGSDDLRVLRNLFLATADFAAEIYLEAWRRKKARIALCGRGILSYYVWRHLNVSFPHSPPIVFVVEQPGEASRLNVITVLEAQRELGDETLFALTDWAYLSEIATGKSRPGWQKVDLSFIARASSKPLWRFFSTQKGAGPAGSYLPPNWSYALLSGDHDLTLPSQVAGAYFNGRLRGLASGDLDDARRFEEKHILTFPSGFAGV